MTTTRRYSFKALAGGVLAYAAAKLAAVGVVTGTTLSDIGAAPAIFLPAMGALVLHEVVACAVILGVALLLRVPAAVTFLAVAAVQLALSWWGEVSLGEASAGWAFEKARLDELFVRLGVPRPIEDNAGLGALSPTEVTVTLMAAGLAQVVHNLGRRKAVP